MNPPSLEVGGLSAEALRALLPILGRDAPIRIESTLGDLMAAVEAAGRAAPDLSSKVTLTTADIMALEGCRETTAREKIRAAGGKIPEGQRHYEIPRVTWEAFKLNQAGGVPTPAVAVPAASRGSRTGGQLRRRTARR